MANVCDKFCNGCAFYEPYSVTCNYFLKTGQLRPCPAGTGCTVKDTGKKKTRWKHESDRTWKNKKKKEKQLLHKVCPRCGRLFETENPRKVYCSYQCKNKVMQKEFHQRQKNSADHHLRHLRKAIHKYGWQTQVLLIGMYCNIQETEIQTIQY